jgi:hypothetical protein
MFDHDDHQDHVTREQLDRALGELNERLDQMEASQQSEIDALTASVTQVATDVATVGADLATASTALQGEIDTLKAGNPALDLSALQAAAAPVDGAVQALDAAAKAIGGLVPTPPPFPVIARSVYTFDGDPGAVDTTQWILTAEETTDVPPRALYDYALDVNPGDKLGDGVGGVWHLYSGAVQPVPVP